MSPRIGKAERAGGVGIRILYRILTLPDFAKLWDWPLDGSV
jgi:hypothetical protein